jgi:hypothetical protein
MVEKKHIVSLKGKEYVLWAGLLDAATKTGLRSLTTTVLQIPTADNGNLAVVMARAEFEDGRVFEDVGDCSPASTTPQLASAAIRLASTRAKGRCLRDATNIGMTMYEELPNNEGEGEPNAAAAPPPKNQPARSGGGARVPPAPSARPAANPDRPPLRVVEGQAGDPVPTPAAAIPADEVDPKLDGAAMICCKKTCREKLNGYEHSKAMKRFGKPLCPKCYEAEEKKPVVACSYPGCGLILEDWEVEGCTKKGWGPACKEHRKALKAQEEDEKPPLPDDATLKEMFA